MTGTGGQSPAEQHLGDRLAALVDGELGHDVRERMLAHLATCGKCKAEADAQRQLKTLFAQTAPPPPSEALLARLRGLPASADQDDDRGPFGGAGAAVLGAAERGFGFLPPPAAATGQRGFRVHEIGRPAAPRGRRFAFAAAGAVSLAAFALGGALPLDAAVESRGAQGDGTGAYGVRPAEWRQSGLGPQDIARRDVGLVAADGTVPGALHSAPSGPRDRPAPAGTPAASSSPGVAGSERPSGDQSGSLTRPVSALVDRPHDRRTADRRTVAPAPTTLAGPSAAGGATSLVAAHADPESPGRG